MSLPRCAGFILLFACSLTWSAPRLSAQLTGGAVVGTVKDRSGAVVPGAQVSLRNSGTGVVYAAVTSAQGTFAFPVVPVGEYSFTAKATALNRSPGR